MRFPVAALSLAATFTPSLARSSAVNASAFVSSNGDTQILGTSSKQDAPFSSTSRKGSSVDSLMTDPIYPGTAVERLNNVRLRVAEISKGNDLNGPWEDVRRRILWAGGLRDLSNAIPGKGYTGHSFSDYNHVDLTCMVENVSDNENDGRVKGIALGNQLGEGIRLASLPELGPGGSWSTCAIGCNKEPPQDVAHLQFRARIAFKLVWVPNENFDSFVLVDDDGKLLAKGKPSNTDELPPMRERQLNYRIVEGSKYAFEADKLARSVAAE